MVLHLVPLSGAVMGDPAASLGRKHPPWLRAYHRAPTASSRPTARARPTASTATSQGWDRGEELLDEDAAGAEGAG